MTAEAVAADGVVSVASCRSIKEGNLWTLHEAPVGEKPLAQLDGFEQGPRRRGTSGTVCFAAQEKALFAKVASGDANRVNQP